jgi:hypothetical protein
MKKLLKITIVVGLLFGIVNAEKYPYHENNTIEWYYNAENQDLSKFSKEETIKAIKSAMMTWQNTCGIEFIYKDETNNDIENLALLIKYSQSIISLHHQQ